ncbi:MAG: nuclear transport factor 2 family protein [Pseudolabrys sp.]
MADSETREAVNALYAAYAGHDFDRVASLLHDDIDWVIYGPIDIFPFVGMRRGRAAVVQALAGLAQVYRLQSHRIEVLIVDGDRAAVMADIGFNQIATGRLLRFRVANFLRIADGRLIEFREFADSFDQVEQAIGHAVEI